MPAREIDTLAPDSPVETISTADLVASNRVEGTALYGADGRKVGHVHNFMVNKRTGRVAHVIVSDGGFFGFGGERYLCIPWKDLSYDTDLSGYVAHITKEDMHARGRISADDAEMMIW